MKIKNYFFNPDTEIENGESDERVFIVYEESIRKCISESYNKEIVKNKVKNRIDLLLKGSNIKV
jgi:hypothetical protein